MNSDFVAEILRATGSLRAGDQAGVSAIIQSALAAAGLSDAGADGGPGAHWRRPSDLAAGRRRARAAVASAAETPERGDPDPDRRQGKAGTRRNGHGSRPAGAYPGPAPARGRQLPRSALFVCGRGTPLPALRPRLGRRGPAGARRDAARLHADSGGLRRRHRDERACRRAPAARRLSGANRRRQRDVLLELVPARRSVARFRRTGDHRRPDREPPGRVPDPERPDLRRRSLGRRGDGGDHGRDLSRAL